MTVVSFTPVYQNDDILQLHLEALDRQALDDSWFYDDHDQRKPQLSNRKRLPKRTDLPSRGAYSRSGDTHFWPADAVTRVASIKNWALKHFLASKHEWMLLIDSDVLAPDGMVSHLLEADMPIICAVYWTDWGEGPQPNVWDFHDYGFVEHYDRFRKPDHFRVGGLGACTLVHRTVIESGVNFNTVTGVPYVGEDRHFSIRAAAADIPLIACTHSTPFHVYDDSQLEEARLWLTSQ